MQQGPPARASPGQWLCCSQKGRKGPERVSERPGGCTGAVRRAGQCARSKHSADQDTGQEMEERAVLGGRAS